MKISGYNPITSIVPKTPAMPSPKDQASFGEILEKRIAQIDEYQKTADKAVTDFTTGKGKNLHEAVLALEMADTSLRLAVTVRNKALEAYNEIMKMPV